MSYILKHLFQFTNVYNQLPLFTIAFKYLQTFIYCLKHRYTFTLIEDINLQGWFKKL